VFAGTSNGTGALRVRVSRAASDTVVARIVAMVEQASATKARTQLFIEKIEQRYSLGMVTATLLLFAVPLIAGAAFQPTLLRAMTFMIVASPCAVVLATMPPLLASMANAGRHGVLVKSAVVMEQLGATTQVAFDKTGTLTEGTPRLTGITVIPGAGLSEHEALALAAAAEAPSEHPLGRAVTTAASDAGLALARADQFTAAPGRGVTAFVNGHRVEVGSPAHLLGGQADREIVTRVAELEDSGQTAAAVCLDGTVIALLAIADRTRPAAVSAVARITEVTGAAPILLTGDNHRAAARLAREVGIGDVRAALLPADKVRAVNDLQSQGARVLLVGDGINDAPALAAAATGCGAGPIRVGPHPGPRARRHRHRHSDGPRRVRPRPGHRRRRDHAGRPGHDPRRHRPVPACPPGGHREPGHRGDHHHRPGDLGPGRAPAAAARRPRPRGLHRHRRPQRPATAARRRLAQGHHRQARSRARFVITRVCATGGRTGT
jgi:cation-transporting P-type ATPase J